MNGITINEQLKKYPMRRSGGLFLILIGLTLLLAIVFSDGRALVNHTIFAIGVVVSILSFSTIKHFAPNRPPAYQIIALGVALGLEFLLFILLVNILPAGTSESTNWLYGSIVVGIHFLPMAYSFGRIMIYLGLWCIGIATIGLLLPNIPYAVFGVIDGLLKLVVGIIMFRKIKGISLDVF